MLIDFGALPCDAEMDARTLAVARDFARATSGRLDVVLVSHSGRDHVSGFIQAREVLDQIAIGEVWLAWTQDPLDVAARRFQAEHSETLKGLNKIIARLGRSGNWSAPALRRMLLRYGSPSEPDAQAAIGYLTNHPTRPSIHYLRPGDQPKTASAEAVGFYVLGAPLPAATSQGVPISPEAGATSGWPVFAAANQSVNAENALAESSQAFKSHERISLNEARGMPFFRMHYLRARDDWRRIDDSWLGSAEPLALSLDRRANESSLAIAIELEPGGRVLLFPGDSRPAAWKSWLGSRWSVSGGPRRAVSAAELLGRTVLYKVSHHGRGASDSDALNLMTSPELAALLPVDRAAAERMGWNLPAPDLVEKLRRQTRGRLFQPGEPRTEHLTGAAAFDQDDLMRRTISDPNGLFIEYAVLSD